MQVRRRLKTGLIAVGCGAGLALQTHAAEDTAAPEAAATEARPQQLPRQTVRGQRQEGPFGAALEAAGLRRARSGASDTAQLLKDLPGVSLHGAGGVSSLPVINGLADDRLRTQVDGMDLVAACPNHMNPGLSYIDPSRVGAVRVYAGITPVSVGGDSLGGSIQIESRSPEFAASGEPWLSQGEIGSFYRSNGAGRGGHLTATLASETLHLSVSAATVKQHNLRAARAFKPAAAGSESGPVIPGEVIGSSAYDARNEDLRLAWRGQQQLIEFTAGQQRIGFEGFPNQRMDMTGNQGRQLNLRYSASFESLRLKGRLWRQTVEHAMDMGPDRFFYGFGMPMLTEATSEGLQLQAEADLREDAQLRLGAERQTYVLYDWWPPVGGSMGPNAFWNIDNGKRLRDGAFVEWESRWGEAWQTLAGLRLDRVSTSANKVQGYDNGLGAIWGNEAAAFNAGERARADTLLDLAFSARWQADAATQLELGLARKSHAPNLYQRYAWSTQPMAALMNNFVGDGNGYIGLPALRPEVAHTLALNAHWQPDAQRSLRFSGYLTQVRDYIDARRCDFGQCSAANASTNQGFVLLQYANVPARLWGLDLSAQQRLAAGSWGQLEARAALGLVRGSNRATGDGLYNLMPAQLRLTLEQQLGAFSHSLELQGVAAKTRRSQVRNEMATPGYALLSWRASYAWAHGRVDLGVDNLFNRFYSAPLGGAYLGQGRSMTSAGIPWGTPVPGAGRSINTTVTLWL